MKRISALFGKKEVYDVHENTASTDDLSAGFGKRFVFTGAAKNGEAVALAQPASDCWFDVSEEGIKVLDRDEKALMTFPITKINIFESVGQSSNAPAFQFQFHSGSGFDIFKFHTLQADAIFTVFNEAIQKARKSMKQLQPAH